MHAILDDVQLIMRSPSLATFVIRKLVHLLQASAPLYNLGMFN